MSTEVDLDDPGEFYYDGLMNGQKRSSEATTIFINHFLVEKDMGVEMACLSQQKTPTRLRGLDPRKREVDFSTFIFNVMHNHCIWYESGGIQERFDSKCIALRSSIGCICYTDEIQSLIVGWKDENICEETYRSIFLIRLPMAKFR